MFFPQLMLPPPPSFLAHPIQEVLCQLANEDRESVVRQRAARDAGITEDSEQITVVHRHFVLQQIKRQKYRCKCQIGVHTAPGRPRRSRAGATRSSLPSRSQREVLRSRAARATAEDHVAQVLSPPVPTLRDNNGGLSIERTDLQQT